jgi:hypothetical protein
MDNMQKTQKTNVLITPSAEAGMEGATAAHDTQKTEGKKRPSKKLLLFILILFLLSGVSSSLSLLAYQKYNPIYRNDLSLAQTGIQHLRNAATLLEGLSKKPFDPAAVTRAQHEFADASAAFGQVKTSLMSLPGVLTVLPVYGSRLSTALRLLPLAIEVSQAGIAGCSILNILLSRFHDPLNARVSGLTMVDVNVIAKNLHQIKAIVDMAVNQVNQLQPSDLQFDARLGKMIATFRTSMPALQARLSDLEGLLPIVPTLLGIGTPAHYLIEMVDSTELRPTGGFIGNYGIATLAGGRLTDAHITDIYLLDYPYEESGGHIPYPPAYTWFSQHLSSTTWSFRDSNLEADFPTSALMGELNYVREGGNVPVQGVISITPAFIQQMLNITGPIAIPEYHETVTAQNLIDRIHYHQLGQGREGNDTPSSDGHSSVRKHFTELLAEHFMARVHQLSSSELPAFLPVMMSALHTKDIQIYLNASKAENLLRNLHLASTIATPVADNFFVVDTNIAADKANAFIVSTLNDQVTINANGDAIHNTTLRYAWVIPGYLYGNPVYRDYVRVYMPPGARVSRQSGWQPNGTNTAYGRTILAGSFTLLWHQTVEIHLVWKVLHTASIGAGGWHYLYQLQRQAGALWNVHLQVTLPSCAVVKSTQGGLTSHNNRSATLNQTLNEDLLVGVNYTC